MAGSEDPSYMLAVYIVVPFVVCLALVGVVLLLCCSRRNSLNWYERSLLDSLSKSDQDSEKAFLHRSGSTASSSKYHRSHLEIRHPHFDDTLPPITVGHGSMLVVTKKVKPQHQHGDPDNRSMGSGSSSPSSPDHSPVSSFSEHFSSDKQRISCGGTVVLPGITSNGSSPRKDPWGGPGRRESTTPSLGSMGGGEARRDSAEFWVPPTVLKKKRAQSLLPNMDLYPGSGEGTQESSPNVSPMGPPTAEMVFTYSPEKMSESVSLVQVPAGQRRRRASMQDALDPTTINARMYEQMMKSHHDTIGSIQEENLGTINISLRYKPDQGLLIVRLIQARDLTAQDFSGTSDPYCRICLLPNRRFQLQSRVHKNTLNPEFEEEFMFDAQPHNVNSRTLEVLMYDFDQFSRDELMGQVLLPLEHIDLSEDVVLWKGIAPYERKEEILDRGDVMFSLGYLSSAERLTVVVLKARNLRFTDEVKGTPNPFVKVSLISNNKRIKKKKTSTKRSAAFPVWNEALAFNLNKAVLKHITIELDIYSDSLIGNNEFLGRVIIGPDSSGEELSHWNDMLNSKNAMARWHHVTS